MIDKEMICEILCPTVRDVLEDIKKPERRKVTKESARRAVAYLKHRAYSSFEKSGPKSDSKLNNKYFLKKWKNERENLRRISSDPVHYEPTSLFFENFTPGPNDMYTDYSVEQLAARILFEDYPYTGTTEWRVEKSGGMKHVVSNICLRCGKHPTSERHAWLCSPGHPDCHGASRVPYPTEGSHGECWKHEYAFGIVRDIIVSTQP